MNTFNPGSFRLARIATLVAVAFGAQSAVAAEDGEDGADDAIEVITVTGLRSSLAQSVYRKRMGDTVSDVIVAEDIGNLPDRNVAEALQRVTGVSITRDNGEGTSVTIRGIADNLNLTLMNGQTIASAGDGRGIDFSSMPSSMISAVEVYKSPMAKHIEGSIGGTINILTARPLDVGVTRGSAFVEAAYENESTPAVSLSYMTPLSETFGVAVALSHEELETRTDALTNASWTDSPTGFYPTRWSVSAQERNRKRSSAILNLQWQPIESINTYLDMNYSKIEDDFEKHAFTTWIPYGYGVIDAASIVTDSATNTMTEFAVDSLYISPVDEKIVADVDTINAQLGGDFKFEKFTVSASVGYSKAETEELTQQIYNFDHWFFNGDQHDGMFRLTGDRQYAYLPWGTEFYDPGRTDNDASDVYVAGGNNSNLNRTNQGPIIRLPVQNTDEDLAFRLDGFYPLVDSNFLTSLEAGIRLGRREKETLSASQHLGPWEIAINNATLWGQEPLFHDQNSVQYSPSDFMGGNANAGIPTTWNAITDFDDAVADYTAHMNRLFGLVDDGSGPYFTDFESIYEITGKTPDRRGSADNKEETAAIYVQANIDALDGDLTGNAGVRYVKTDLTSTALTGTGFAATNGGELIPITMENDYDDFLPSVNLSYRFNDDMILRFAAARVMARPNFNQAKAGATTATDGWYDVDGYNDPAWVVADEDSFSGGNVKLDPYEANQFDISFEYYFGEGNMVSAGLFHKDVSSFVFNLTEVGSIQVEGYETELGRREPFATYADSLLGEVRHTDANGNITDAEGRDIVEEYPLFFETVQRPVNGEGGRISGIELAALTDLGFISGLDNFGVQANYTYADSDADYLKDSFGDQSIDLPYQYQSEHSYNLVGYYENESLMVRLAYNWRSESLETPTNSLDGMAIWRDDYGQLDTSFSYYINDSMKIMGSISNLLEESTEFFSAERTDGNLIKGDAVPTNRNYNQTYNGRTFRLGFHALFE